MRIFITAPSLNPSKNVSGVSTVADTIIRYNQAHHYFHYLLGRPDEQLIILNWFNNISTFKIISSVFCFIGVIYQISQLLVLALS